MKARHALAILIAAGSMIWLLVDPGQPAEPAPVGKATSRSRSSSASATRTEPRWQPRTLPAQQVVAQHEANGPLERKPVHPDDAQACETSETCGDARACVDGQCVHCVADSECEAGMICALSRCMVPDDIDCAGDEQCGEGGYCITDVRAEGPARARYFSYCTDEHQQDAISVVNEQVPLEGRALAAEANSRERAELFARAGFGQAASE